LTRKPKWIDIHRAKAICAALALLAVTIGGCGPAVTTMPVAGEGSPIAAASLAVDTVVPTASSAWTPTPASTTTPPAANPSAAPGPLEQEFHLAQISARINLKRTPGTGSCGIEPWKIPGCSGSFFWWGEMLRAEVSSPVLVLPGEDGSWQVTNQPDEAARLGLDPARFLQTGGSYQMAQLNFGEQAGDCQGTIGGAPFGLHVTGSYSNGSLRLFMTADAVESMRGTCGTTKTERSATDLVSGWAAAISGDPTDLTIVFSERDRLTGGWGYHREADDIQTNPSPWPRDLVEAQMDFFCILSEDSQTAGPCPWQQH